MFGMLYPISPVGSVSEKRIELLEHCLLSYRFASTSARSRTLPFNPSESKFDCWVPWKPSARPEALAAGTMVGTAYGAIAPIDLWHFRCRTPSLTLPST